MSNLYMVCILLPLVARFVDHVRHSNVSITIRVYGLESDLIASMVGTKLGIPLLMLHHDMFRTSDSICQSSVPLTVLLLVRTVGPYACKFAQCLAKIRLLFFILLIIMLS